MYTVVIQPAAYFGSVFRNSNFSMYTPTIVVCIISPVKRY